MLLCIFDYVFIMIIKKRIIIFELGLCLRGVSIQREALTGFKRFKVLSLPKPVRQ